MRRRLRSLLVLLPLSIALFVLAPSRQVAAHGGLAFGNTTTYTIDAVSGVVHVLAEIDLENTIPDQRDGNYINRRYFTGFTLPVPVGAINQVATTPNGRTLAVTPRLIDGNGDFFVLDIDLASNLFYPHTQRVSVAYDIAGQPPRSENPSRVNGAYAAFDAFGVGDEGRVTVRVVVPPGFVIDTLGDDATVTEENGNTVYTASNIPNPDQFDLFISARNDAGLAPSTATTPDGDEFAVRSWPGDADWQSFVTTQIQEGVPVLGDLVGQPWPIDQPVEVREAYTPYLYGYAGWFSVNDKDIEIGEDLDAEVVLHELSHAWFNDGWFADRWLDEGLAQVYSNKAVAAMGGTALEPDEIIRTDAGHVDLNDWDDPFRADGSDAEEDYGYNASFSVVKSIVDEVGEDKMREIFAAVVDKSIAYRGDAEPETYDVLTDWRRFLDLVDELGGAQSADDLIKEWVVTDSQAELLATRAETRDAYQQLADDGDEWAPPSFVREKMAAWSFTAAQKAIDASHDVLELRNELDTKSAELGTTYPGDLESEYEAAADDVDAIDDAAAAVQQQIDSADAVLAAVTAEAADDGVLDEVGLIGTHLPALLDEAREALSAGDHDLARAKAREVVDTVAAAPEVGKRRTLWAGGAALALVLLVTLLIVLLVRRRRRRRRSSGDAGALDLDEDALAGAGHGGIDDPLDVARVHDGEAAGTTGIVERPALVGDVGDAVLELDEDIGAVIDAQPVAGAQVLVDPHPHPQDATGTAEKFP